jgi:hypothetical protein
VLSILRLGLAVLLVAVAGEARATPAVALSLSSAVSTTTASDLKAAQARVDALLKVRAQSPAPPS